MTNSTVSKNTPLSKEDLLSKSQSGSFSSFLQFQRSEFLSFLQYDKQQREKKYLEALLEEACNIDRKSEENDFSLRYKGYEIAVDALREGDVTYLLRHSLTYNCRIRLLLHSSLNGKEKDIKVMLLELPFISPRNTFIVNGFERMLVPQLIRTKGIHFGRVRGKGSEEYYGSIRPEYGMNITFYSHSVSRRKGSGIFFSINNLKMPWYALLTVLFFDNVHAMLVSLFGTKIVTVRGNFDNEKSMAEYMCNSSELKYVTLDTLHNHASANEMFCSLYKGENSSYSFNCYDIPASYTFLFENIDMKYYMSSDIAGMIYSKVRGSVILEDALVFVRKIFTDERYFSIGEVGRYITNQKLGTTNPTTLLTIEDIWNTVKYLVALRNGENGFETDDENSLSHRYVKSIAGVLNSELRSVVINMKQQLGDRIELALNKRQKGAQWLSTLVQDCISATNGQRRINSIFSQNACSQFLDQVNPLSELLHKSKVMSTGDEGISKDFASFDHRNLHSSFYGRLCCVSTPEGPSVGLVNYFATYATINEKGFICAPYFKVNNGKIDTDQIFYIDALTEKLLKLKIAQYTTIRQGNNISSDKVLCRSDNDLLFVERNEVEFIEVYNNQFVSISACLIPFLEHNDNTRANMASNMQRQSLPLLFSEKPLVQTGAERKVIKQSKYAICAESDGEVVHADNKEIHFVSGDKKKVYHLRQFERSNQNTALGHRLVVRKGQKLKEGDIMADALTSREGVLALGSNLLVAIMPFYGWNFEDAVVISDRCVKEDALTSISVNEYITYVRKTKKGEEKVTKNLPFVKGSEVRQLDENGVVRVGAFVGGNDILVGKLTPQASTPLSKTDEKVMRAIFGDKFLDFHNTSLRLPVNSEGIVIDVEEYVPQSSIGIMQDVLKVVKVYVAHRARIEVGDKICGRYGNKTVISKILPECDMPFLSNGRRVDMVINPLGITSRMNIGQIMEMNCTLATNKEKEIVASSYSTFSAIKIAEMLQESGYAADGKVQLYDGISGDPFLKPAVVGYMYTLKLEHMVSLKFHARSIGPYSIITKQPVGGKVRFGGQRCGEMELWSLEAYGASSTILEKITVLSDDHENKQILLRNIMYGRNKFNFGVSSTFQVLIRHLNALLLDVKKEEEKNNEA